MNPAAIYSRTGVSWQLAFVHAGKMLHHLKSALLLSLASAGLGLAWLCCWLDRFLSGRRAGSWIISARPAQRIRPEPARPAAVPEKLRPLAFERNKPRTIDSLIHNEMGSRICETGNAPLLH